LRFFAAAAIVFLHMQARIFGLPTDARLGLGVGFFFVLSGFILAYVYRDFTGNWLRAFYIARFARLWPVHIVTLLIAALVIQPHALQYAIFAMTLPYHLTMTHAWLPINGLVVQWNGPSWSISDEIWFYLVFPFLASVRRPLILLISIAIICLLMLFISNTIGYPTSKLAWTFNANIFIQHHPAMRTLEFAVGVVAGRYFNAGNRVRGNQTALELAAVAIVVLFGITSHEVYAWLHSAGAEAFGLWYSQSGGCVLFAFAILIFAQSGGVVSKLLSWRFFVILGEISFSTYMLHALVIRFATEHDWIGAIGRPATAVATLSLIYFGSWLLWRYVEVPARHRLTQAVAP